MPKQKKLKAVKQRPATRLAKKPKLKLPANHHDLFFKTFYSKPAFARELFSLTFNKKEFKVCNWDKLKEEKDTLKEKRADLVFSVPLKAHPKTRVKIFILLEHKSYYDEELFSQLLYYQTLLFEQSLKEAGQAMPIIPIVFYHGKTPWKWAKSFQSAVYKDFLKKIPVSLRKNMINYEIKLLSAQDAKLKGVFRDKSFKSRGALYLLQKIWKLKLSQDELKDVLSKFSDFSKDGKGTGLIASVYDYLNAVLKEGKKLRRLLKAVEQELVEEGVFTKGGYMDTIQYMKEQERMKGLRKGLRKGIEKGRMEGIEEGRMEGIEEGMEKGIEKGRKEVIVNMLKKKVDTAFISKVTGLPTKEIKKLQNGSA